MVISPGSLGSGSRPEGGWCGSIVVMEELEELQRMGCLPCSSWRAPEIEGELHPRLEERVLFISIVKRGLSVPVNRFVWHLLGWYGIQLHHLTPHNITYMACFVTFCEGYLGVVPSLELWRAFFFLCGQIKGEGSEEMVCGKARIVPRRSRLPCLGLQPDEPSWMQSFFYGPNLLSSSETSGLPPFVWGLPLSQSTWLTKLPVDETVVAMMGGHLEVFLADILHGLDLLLYWMKRRIQPLQARPHPLG
ncbi:hypothetical protein ACQ4PT_007809 [Festuca glaucescens]